MRVCCGRGQDADLTQRNGVSYGASGWGLCARLGENLTCPSVSIHYWTATPGTDAFPVVETGHQTRRVTVKTLTVWPKDTDIV